MSHIKLVSLAWTAPLSRTKTLPCLSLNLIDKRKGGREVVVSEIESWKPVCPDDWYSVFQLSGAVKTKYSGHRTEHTCTLYLASKSEGA